MNTLRHDEIGQQVLRDFPSPAVQLRVHRHRAHVVRPHRHLVPRRVHGRLDDVPRAEPALEGVLAPGGGGAAEGPQPPLFAVADALVGDGVARERAGVPLAVHLDVLLGCFRKVAYDRTDALPPHRHLPNESCTCAVEMLIDIAPRPHTGGAFKYLTVRTSRLQRRR